jgi:hypothetical protein
LAQGCHSVDIYTQIFNELSHEAGYNEEAMRHAYLQGLNQDIEDKILNMAKIPKTLTELQDQAALLDLQSKVRRNKGQMTTYKEVLGTPTGTHNNPILVNCQFVQLSEEKKDKLMAAGKCFKCKETGHCAN